MADGVEPVARTVTIGGPDGLRAALSITGADSYVELDEDGEAAETSGSIASDGDRITLQADETLRIRVGNAGAVRVSINGITVGTMGGDGAVVEWRVERIGG